MHLATQRDNLLRRPAELVREQGHAHAADGLEGRVEHGVAVPARELVLRVVLPQRLVLARAHAEAVVLDDVEADGLEPPLRVLRVVEGFAQGRGRAAHAVPPLVHGRVGRHRGVEAARFPVEFDLLELAAAGFEEAGWWWSVLVHRWMGWDGMGG